MNFAKEDEALIKDEVLIKVLRQKGSRARKFVKVSEQKLSLSPSNKLLKKINRFTNEAAVGKLLQFQ